MIKDIDVWDFGAEVEDGVYNNLTPDVINSFYEGIEGGTSGVDISTFSLCDHEGKRCIDFVSNKDNNRIRTTNPLVTRKDDNGVKVGKNGKTYQGVIYSNSYALIDTRFEIWMEEGQTYVFVLSSNGNPATYILLDEDDCEVDRFLYTCEYGCEEARFAVAKAGHYKLYCVDEKIVCSRIMRINNHKVRYSGAIEYRVTPETSYKLLFRNVSNKKEYFAKIHPSDNTYNIELYEGYDYEVEFVNEKGLMGFVVSYEFPGNVIVIDRVKVVKLCGGLYIDTFPEGFSVECRLKDNHVKRVFKPVVKRGGPAYEVYVEPGIEYELVFDKVWDYEIENLETEVCIEKNTLRDFKFKRRKTYEVTCERDFGLSFKNVLDGAIYGFSKDEKIMLRNGRYEVHPLLDFKPSLMIRDNYDLVVDGKPVTLELNVVEREEYSITMGSSTSLTLTDLHVGDVVNMYYYQAGAEKHIVKLSGDETYSCPYESVYVYINAAKKRVAYRSELRVGPEREFKTVTEALDHATHMDRKEDERVTIFIDPGNYEENIIVKTDNITIKNSLYDSGEPDISLRDCGTHIGDRAVRITWYYGHGYDYYSMGEDLCYSPGALAVNRFNDRISEENPGAGWHSLWNATVRVFNKGFKAYGIIFENSFNQYISPASKKDVIKKRSNAHEGEVSRTAMEAYDTKVSEREYIERAACLALRDGIGDVYFENCRFVGRQDTLYGGDGVKAVFDRCIVMGSVDYIFGGMVALFNKCQLLMNTSDRSASSRKHDKAYIAAPRQLYGRGYVFYKCRVDSAIPKVDNDSDHRSKPGYFGRPWQSMTSEALFYKTVIAKADPVWGNVSIIDDLGFMDNLGGKSPLCKEYASIEEGGFNNTDKRVGWCVSEEEPDTDTVKDIEAFVSASLACDK